MPPRMTCRTSRLRLKKQMNDNTRDIGWLMDRRKDDMRELEQTVDRCIIGMIGKKIDEIANSTRDIDLTTMRKIEESSIGMAHRVARQAGERCCCQTLMIRTTIPHSPRGGATDGRNDGEIPSESTTGSENNGWTSGPSNTE